jgi:hypothetical protein
LSKLLNTIENSYQFLVKPLIDKVKKDILLNNPSICQEDLKAQIISLATEIDVHGQKLNFVPAVNHLGGYRWFALCPKCGTRVIKLFLPQEAFQKDSRYLCKACHGLKNTSEVYGASTVYTKVLRPLKKLEKIKKQLDSSRVMARKNFAGMVEEYEMLKKTLTESPEYKLYKIRLESSIKKSSQSSPNIPPVSRG